MLRPRWPHQRRGEVIVGLVGIAIALLGLLALTGLVPGIVPASPITFSQEVPVCSSSPVFTQNSHSLTLPLWASVQLAWTVAPSDVQVNYEVATATGQIVYFALGGNGTGSFPSAGGTYLFTPVFVGYFPPSSNTTCTTAHILTHVSYTV